VILLDTNVLSELMRPAPSPVVVAWVDAQPAQDLWVSSVTEGEILLGLARMPAGKRQQALTESARQMFDQDLAERSLPFDRGAARQYAQIVARRSARGRPITVEDAQIAGIALAAGMHLATRNMRDFEGIEGLTLINPWDA